MESIKVLNLDFRGISNIIQTLKAVQYDDGRAVRVMLSGTEGNISKVRIYCQKPSGMETYTDGTVVNDYCVLFGLTPQMLAEEGIVKSQLQLMDGEHVVTSFDFQIQVSKNRIASSSITSSDEYQALVEAMKNVDKTETDISQNRSEISKIKGKVDTVEQNIDVHTAQIAEMQKIPEGGTTADAALNDIKIGYDGTTYQTPGEAVRGQVGSLSEDIDTNFYLHHKICDIEKMYLCTGERQYIYDTSIFSGWITNYIFEEDTVIKGFYYNIKSREDGEPVTKTRVAVLRNDITNDAVIFEKYYNVEIPIGTDKDLYTGDINIFAKAGDTLWIIIEANKISSFAHTRDAVDETIFQYAINGVFTDDFSVYAKQGSNSKYRLWIKAEVYEDKLRKGLVDHVSIKDKSVSINKTDFLTKKIGNNLFDAYSMSTKGAFYYFESSVGIGEKVTLQVNEYTGNFYAIRIPIEKIISSITLSTESSIANQLFGYFIVDNNDVCIDYQYDISAIAKITTEGYIINLSNLELYNDCDVLLDIRSYDSRDEIYKLMVNSGSEPLSYEDYNACYYLDEKEIQLKEDNNEDFYRPKIVLPNKFDLIVGDTFELFYKGISKCINSDIYDYEVVIDNGSNLGKSYKRKYVYTPEEKDIGEHTVIITMRDNAGNILDQKNTIFKVNEIPVSPQNEEIILNIGDSLSSGGDWILEFYRRITASDGSPTGYGLKNIKFIGKCSRSGVGYEGYGGWTFSSYLSAFKTNQFMNIFGSFNKTESDQHSIYKDSKEQQWKLETIGQEKIKIIGTSTLNVLPQSGTLTWVSGGENHDDIVYSSSEMATGNPFWDSETQSVDFIKYIKQFDASKIDRVNILLGWNSTGDSEETYKEKCRTFLRKILSSFPDCRITLMGLEIPSRDGFGENYGVSWKYFEKLSFVFDLEKWYQDICNEEEFKNNVHYANVSAQFDTEYNMSYTSRNANIRSTQKEIVQTNGVHPSFAGYMQIADVATRDYTGKQ